MEEDFSQEADYIEKSNAEWEHEEVLQLIEIYKNNPELWDPDHGDYHNRPLRKIILKGIAKSLGKTSRSVVSKIRSLRTSYARMNVKIKEAKRKRGSYGGTVWFGYESMDFLSKIYKKGTNDNGETTDTKDSLDDSYKAECSGEESDDCFSTKIYNESWKYEELLQLIDLYREHPELWNTEHVNYHHKQKRLKAIKSIASALQKTGPEIKIKIKSLRSTFHRTDRRVKEAIETKGKFTSKLWFGYKRMSFLDTECAKICETYLESSKPNYDVETNTYSDDDDDDEDHTNSRNSSWTHENIIKLIKMYKNHPEIWDPDHEGSNNRLIRNDVVNLFAKTFQTNKYEIERKIKGLRSQFLRQHKAVLKAVKGESKYPSKLWFGYKHLSFLAKVNENAEFDISNDEEHTLNIDIKQEPFTMESDISLSSEEMPYLTPKERKRSHSDNPDTDPLVVKKKFEPLGKGTRETGSSADSGHCCSSLNEFTAFGQFVSHELKKIKDEYALMLAKSEISSIIFKAQMQQVQKKQKRK